MRRVRISELKSHLSACLRAVEDGESLEVTDRSRAIARLVPLEAAPSALELVPSEQPFSAVRRIRVPRANLRVSSLSALHAERAGR